MPSGERSPSVRRGRSRRDPGAAGSAPGRPDLHGGAGPGAERPEIYPARPRRLRRSPLRYLTASVVILVLCLLLLVQAGASGTRPRPETSPTGRPSCATTFRIAFVADLAGLRSSVDSAGWRGANQAVGTVACAHAYLASAGPPSADPRTLHAHAPHYLGVAGSVMLT